MTKRKRNPNGAGTVTRRADGRYQGAAYVTTTTSRRVRRFVYGRTWEEAHDKLVELQSREHRGVAQPDRVPRLAEFLDYWIENVVKVAKRPATYDLYEVMTRLYLRPGLGRHWLNRLTLAQVQTFLNERAAKGDSARKIQVMRTVLSSALTRAVQEELVSRNVARLVTVAEAVPRQVEPWSPKQVRRFLRAARGDPFHPGYVLLFYLGLRRGEVLGLAWDDVDWTVGTITVRWQGQRSNGALQRRPVKSRAARRVLPLLGVVRDALDEQVTRQAAWRAGAGPAWRESGLVLTTTLGGPVEPRNFNRSFARVCAAADLGSFRPHDARHTCASLLGELNVDPRTAMEILGHSRSSVTLEIYQRASDKSRRAALARVEQRLAVDVNR